MDLITKACEVIVTVNKKWDSLPAAAKPAIAGAGLLVGLLTNKIILGLGVIVFFGQRTINALGIPKQVIDEEKRSEADKGTA